MSHSLTVTLFYTERLIKGHMETQADPTSPVVNYTVCVLMFCHMKLIMKRSIYCAGDGGSREVAQEWMVCAVS